MYTKEEIFDFIADNDVKFIKMAFFDVFGKQKNISILSSELEKAIDFGIAVDASAIRGFGGEEKSDLFLIPDLSTISILPWRPNQGRVARFYCFIKYPNGQIFDLDSRKILKNAVKELDKYGVYCDFGTECEFYLFKKDNYDMPTNIPFDNAGYLDVAPDDKGEDVRREICLTLENMQIFPEKSHHEEGPGQNEIEFKYSDPLSAADNISTVKNVIKTIAGNYGLHASFDPKPLENKPGNGFHINISVHSEDGNDYLMPFMAGVMKHIKEITLFLNSSNDSYKRLGEFKAPKYVTWSYENRSQLIRIPATLDGSKRMELRSPDPTLNPYIAYALLIYAGLEGIKNKLSPVESLDVNLYKLSEKELEKLSSLPNDYQEAVTFACESEFINKNVPKRLLEAYVNKYEK